MYAITTGVAINDPQGYGMGICPLDHPVVSLDSPRLWKCSAGFSPQKPWVFVNFYNNEWTTNFRLWNGGTWSSSVRLWPINRDDPAESLIANSLDARCPLMGAMADGPAGKLPASQPGLEVASKGVQVTAFGPNPDGQGTLLRLWEMAGEKGECRVTLPAYLSIKSAVPVDLRGRPAGAPVPVTDQKLTVQLRAFGPASFLIEK